MAEKVIIDIEMSTEDVRKAQKEIMQSRKQVEALRDANKALDKSSEAYTKNAIEIKKLNQTIRTNERVLVANEKARESNAGSVTQLREQLKFVSKQWADEAKAMGENSERAKKLAKDKTVLTAQLKAVEKQTGDTRRNVGNYSEGMREALSSSNALGQGTNNLFALMKANPLILIITLFAKFAGAVSKAQFIIDGFNKVFEPFNQMFQRAIGLVQELIDGGLSKIAEILKDPIGALMSFGEEMEKAATSGRRLAQLTIEIEEAQNALIITEGKLTREIEEQRFAVEDLSKSEEERQAAAKAAIEAVKQLEQEKLNVLNKEIEAAEIRASQNDTDRAAQKELNELLARRDELAAESVSRQKEIRNQLNTINKQQADEEMRANAERVKNFEESEKKKTEAMRLESERRAQVIKDEIERNNSLYLLGLKNQLLNEEITREEYEAKRRERELQLLTAQRAALVLNGQETIEVDNQIADLKIQNIQRVQAVEQGAAKVQEDIKSNELDTFSTVANASIDIAKKAAGENAEASKALGLITTGVNIATAITKALAQGGPILGPVLSGVVAALGAVQQAKIRSTPTNFADGVIGLDGPGSETSDSIPANLSRGESVITARATKVYAPVLAQMEQSVGNSPNFQLGRHRFNKGIIAAGNLPAVNAGRGSVNVAQDFERALDKMKVFVSLTELNERQRDYDQARNFATITE